MVVPYNLVKVVGFVFPVDIEISIFAAPLAHSCRSFLL